MQKVILRLSVFLSALFIGIGFLNFQNNTSEFRDKGYDMEVLTTRDTKLNIEQKTSFVANSYQISPCINEIKYKPNSKSKTVARGVLNGLVACGELPEYPQTAVEKNISGVVILDISADDTGRITKAAVREGNPLLNAAAVKAAYQTRICPTLLGGRFMKINGILAYKFDRETGVYLQKNSPVNRSAEGPFIR